jgi:hypothetical protein
MSSKTGANPILAKEEGKLEMREASWPWPWPKRIIQNKGVCRASSTFVLCCPGQMNGDNNAVFRERRETLQTAILGASFSLDRYAVNWLTR